MKRILLLLFAPCEGISALVSRSMDEELTRAERLAVRVHLLYCRACRHYRRNIRALRAMLQAQETASVDGSSQTLDAAARARIIEAIERATAP